MRYFIIILIAINLYAETSTYMPNNVLEMYNLKCKNNSLVFPEKYADKYTEKLNLIHLLLLEGHLPPKKSCGYLQYSIIPFIFERALEKGDTFFLKILLDSNIVKNLGTELKVRLFYDYQLPLIIKSKDIDKLKLSTKSIHSFAHKFCKLDVNVYEEIGEKDFYDRDYVLKHMHASDFLDKFSKKISSLPSCELKGTPILLKSEKWDSYFKNIK